MLLISRHNQLHFSPTFHKSFCCSFFLSMGVCFCLWDSVKSMRFVTSDAIFSFPFSLPLFFPLFFSFFFLYCFTTCTGDQSPSSPASRWPGANYGNRTLGVCVITFLTWCRLLLHCTSAGCCVTLTSIMCKYSNWAGLQHAES